MGALQDRCCTQTGSTPAGQTPNEMLYAAGAPAKGHADHIQGKSAKGHAGHKQGKAALHSGGGGRGGGQHGQEYWGDDGDGYGADCSPQGGADAFVLDGVWLNAEGQEMGKIVNHWMRWDITFGYQETQLVLGASGQFTMKLLGEDHTAEFEGTGGSARLRWNDGDMWARRGGEGAAGANR